MQITVEVAEEIRGEAELRGVPVVDFVEEPMTRGTGALRGNTSVWGAIERIRALRPGAQGPRK